MSISNKRSHRMRTGPHDYGPREWGVFFDIHTWMHHYHARSQILPCTIEIQIGGLS